MYAFDGRELRPRGEDVLGQVGRCASASPDTELCVAGHVGPKESEAYEQALARAHADAAAIDLERAGAGRQRLTVAVRGGEIVTGSGGVAGPPVERRVEIDLRNVVPCTGWP
jgi:outer membrane protein OmpA-like peptidoglycan-associated protein